MLTASTGYQLGSGLNALVAIPGGSIDKGVVKSAPIG
jgi:hypothetical protein